MCVFHRHIKICVTKTFPVLPVHGILFFSVCTSDCIVLVVPNKILCILNGNCKLPKHVFVWITCILGVRAYSFFVPQCSIIFWCKSTRSRLKTTFSSSDLPELVTFKMPSDSLLLDVPHVKSVAGCEPVAVSTDHHSMSLVVQPDSLPLFS